MTRSKRTRRFAAAVSSRETAEAGGEAIPLKTWQLTLPSRETVVAASYPVIGRFSSEIQGRLIWIKAPGFQTLESASATVRGSDVEFSSNI